MVRSTLRELARIRPGARAFLYGSALMGAAHAVPWTLLALYLDRLGYGKQEIGLVQSADSWGKVLIAIPAAVLLARRSAGPIFVGAAGVAGVAYCVLPWLGSLRALSACNLVAGLALSVHYVGIAPFLFRHTGERERAAVFGLAEAVRTLAAVGGAFLAGRFVTWTAPLLGGEANALAWAISGAGALALAGAVAYARILDGRPVAAAREPVLPLLARHRAVLLRFALPQFLIASGAGFCMPFLSLYFKDRFGLDPGGWGTLFALGQVLMTTGFLLTPFAVARLGFVRSMVAIELSSVPFFLLLAFTRSFPVAVLAFLVRGALMNATHPILKHFMMQATPEGARELQTGINATLWGIGWVVGPVAAGRVLEATGDDYTVLMCTTVVLYVLAAGLSFGLLGSLDPTRRPAAPGAGRARACPTDQEREP